MGRRGKKIHDILCNIKTMLGKTDNEDITIHEVICLLYGANSKLYLSFKDRLNRGYIKFL